MSKLTCPICGNINSINQNCCSVCNYPLVTNRLNFSSLSSPIKAELFPQEAIKWAKNLYLQNLQLKIDLESFHQDLHSNQAQAINDTSLNGGVKMVENVQDLVKNITEMLVLLQNKLNEQPEQRSLIQSELNNLNQILTNLSQKPASNFVEYISNSSTQLILDSPPEKSPETNPSQPEINPKNQEVTPTTPPPKSETSTNPPQPVAELSPWLNAYNDKPDFFADYAIDVIISKDSFNQHSQDPNQPVILEKVGKYKGMFWILEPTRIDQCLVPKGNLKVDVDNLPLIQALFECLDYYPENCKFTLIKPALIAPIKANQWRLTELGIIHFS
jgi:hypothetical protein